MASEAQKNDLVQLRAAIELSRRPGVGAATFKELVDRYGSPSEALRAKPRQLSLNGVEGKAALRPGQLDEAVDLPEGIGFTYYGAADYPTPLNRLSEPPPYLFRRGQLWPFSSPAVAIVGPRRCSEAGRDFARELAEGLAAREVPIVSGGALGIDTSAHEGALCAGGSTVLVTATGADRVYPKENESLFLRAQQQGCIMTELLPGTPPRRDFFPTRNRIIVGLSDAVVVVEGKLRTGTWSSASHALRQKRTLFTWSAADGGAERELSELLEKRGAFRLTESDPEKVMKEIAAVGRRR